jgi:hypothetical protein
MLVNWTHFEHHEISHHTTRDEESDLPVDSPSASCSCRGLVFSAVRWARVCFVVASKKLEMTQ